MTVFDAKINLNLLSFGILNTLDELLDIFRSDYIIVQEIIRLLSNLIVVGDKISIDQATFSMNIVGKCFADDFTMNDELKHYVFRCFSKLSNYDAIIEMIVGSSKAVVKIMDACNVGLKNAENFAAMTFANLFSGNDYCARIIIDFGGLEHLCFLLRKTCIHIRREVAFAFSNLMAVKDESIIEEVFSSELVSMVFSYFYSEGLAYQKEVLLGILQLLEKKEYSRCQQIIDLGACEIVVKGLDLDEPVVVIEALRCFESFLEYGTRITMESEDGNFMIDVFDRFSVTKLLMNIQKSNNNQIFNKVGQIIDTYYE